MKWEKIPLKNKTWEKISSGLHFSPWGIHVLAIRASVEKAWWLSKVLTTTIILAKQYKSELHCMYAISSFQLYCLLIMPKFLSFSFCRISIKFYGTVHTKIDNFMVQQLDGTVNECEWQTI